MNEKIYVIAGNHQEYENFSRRKVFELYNKGDTSISLSNFVYVSGPTKLRGLRNIHGYFIGTFTQRSDIEELKRYLCVINNVSYDSLP